MKAILLALATGLAVGGAWYWDVSRKTEAATQATNQVSFTLNGAAHIDGTAGTNRVRQFVNLEFRDDNSVTWVAGKVVRR